MYSNASSSSNAAVGNFDLLSEMLAGVANGSGGSNGGGGNGGGGGQQQGGGGGGQQAQYNHQALLEQRLKLNQLQQLQLQNQIIQQQVSLVISCCSSLPCAPAFSLLLMRSYVRGRCVLIACIHCCCNCVDWSCVVI